MPAVTSFTPYVVITSPIALLITRCRAKQPAIPSLPSARANDPCRYWKLWDHPEDIDSIIACLMWRDKHRLRAMDIAAALAFVQPAEYWGINAEDVINVYEYLQNYQDIPENPYSDWQSMRDMRTHPHWRYYVTWASSCNIQRMQKSLDASLLPVHEQLETSK